MLDPSDPLYDKWTKLDEKLDAMSGSAKRSINLQLTSMQQLNQPWIVGAFKLPIVFNLFPGHPTFHEAMNLEKSDHGFRTFVRQQDRQSLPSSNGLHCEQHFVSRALFIAADRLRTAVAFSNLDQMNEIRGVMLNLLQSLDILVKAETTNREAVDRILSEEEGMVKGEQ